MNQSGDHPTGYVGVEYLTFAADLMRRFKERTYELMRVEAGQRVLDVGCGPGTDTLPLAHLVGPTGQAVGVDFDREMLAEADRRALAEGVTGWTVHARGDATGGLPFRESAFDSCRSERLFQHLRAPGQALAEMARVTKPDGWIVVLDTDHATKSFDTPEADIERRLIRFAAEHLHINGFSGRTLYRMFRRQGLIDVYVETIAVAFTDYAAARRANLFDEMETQAVAAGVVTAAEIERWRASLEQAAARGEFYGTGTGTLIAGRRPAVRA